ILAAALGRGAVEEFFARLKEHKLVQWTLGYIAVSFALLPELDIVAERFGWSQTMVRCLIIALGTGFFVMLVIAWYHGERGAGDARSRAGRSENRRRAAIREPQRRQGQRVLRRRHAGSDPDQAGRHRRSQGDLAHLDREVRQPPG